VIRAKIVALIAAVFGVHAHEALNVAQCESRLNPGAVSRTRDVGVFQINYRWHRRPGESFAHFRRRMSNPRTNIRFAYRLSRGGRDWHAWVCQP